MQVYCTNCGATAVGTSGAECPEACGGNVAEIPEASETFSTMLQHVGKSIIVDQIRNWSDPEFGNPKMIQHWQKKLDAGPLSWLEAGTEWEAGTEIELDNGTLSAFAMPPGAIPARNVAAIGVVGTSVSMVFNGAEGVWLGQATCGDRFNGPVVFGVDADQVYATAWMLRSLPSRHKVRN
jgi:hypothetical protein